MGCYWIYIHTGCPVIFEEIIVYHSRSKKKGYINYGPIFGRKAGNSSCVTLQAFDQGN